MDFDALRLAIMEAWDRWLATDDHLDNCIGFSEGQTCCVQKRQVFLNAQGEQVDANYYGGRQTVLLDLVMEQVRAAAPKTRARALQEWLGLDE